jgi:dipeptide transport system substrate-binding protein
MEMEKKNFAIILLVVLLGASGVGNIILAMELGVVEIAPPPKPNVLVFGTAGNIPDLDPHAAYDSASIDVFDQVVERLYDFNLTDPYYNIYPRLATDFPVITGGGTIWTISLRPGVVFHDNTTMTASDVKWSFDRLMYFCNESNPDHLPAPFNESLPISIAVTPIKTLYTLPDGRLTINRTEVVDPLTVRLHLNAPKASLLGVLCYAGSGILSPEAYDYTTTVGEIDYPDYIPISYPLVGSGPFMYDHFIYDVEVEFNRFDDYWGENAKLEKLIYVIIDDTNTRNQALLSGDVDLIDAPDVGFYPQFEADPNIVHDNYGSSVGINYMGINVEVLPNPLMRKAIAYSVNYTYMTEEIMLGRADRLKSPIPLGIPMANDTLNYPVYDLALARQIIVDNDLWGANTVHGLTLSSDTAAWNAVADGGGLIHINTSYNTETVRRRLMAEFVALDSLYDIGIKADVFGYDWGTYLDILYEQSGRSNDEWVIYVLGWGPDYIDPENYITPIYTATAGPNGMRLNDSYLEGLMASGEYETDLVARKAIYDEIQRYLLEDLYCTLYCFTAHNFDSWRAGVNGFPSNALGQVDFAPVYWA